MSFVKRYKYEFAVLCVVIVAALLRFYRLDRLGLWHDELFTLNQADPQLSWEETFRLLSLDTHPPLYVVVSKLVYKVLGYTEWAARFPAALAGVLIVPVMYQYGKYLADKRLGLIAAVICCVTNYAISYSQEGRDYSSLMLFSAISCFYFLRLASDLSLKSAIGFIVGTTLMIYTHYYGVFVLVAEGLVVCYLLFTLKEQQRLVALVFAGSFAAVALCYLPWLPYMLSLKELPAILSDHMVLPPITFPLHYYYDFFGANMFTLPFLLVLPYIFLLSLLRRWRVDRLQVTDKASLFFLLFVACFIVGSGIPYILSVIRKPMITARYMIFLLPSYILLLAWGAWAIKRRILAFLAIGIFAVVELYDVIVVNQRYTGFYKEQVREVTAFIMKQGPDQPMIDEWMAWRHKYYLEKYGYNGEILNYNGSIWPTKHNKEWMVDSILARTANYDIDTFWIVTINEDEPLSPGKRAQLDTAFNLIKEGHYLYANALLFARKQ